MTQNKKIAVTGGIGSGKSTLLNILHEKGYPVFSCDEINRALLQDEEYLHGLKELFPACFKGNRLQKELLVREVFANEKSAKKLEGYAHPRIMEELLQRMNEQTGVRFVEVPLLFEGNYASQFDEIIVLLRDKNTRISSVVTRDHCSKEAVEARIARQFDYGVLPNHCTVFYNNGDLESLKRAVEKFLLEKLN